MSSYGAESEANGRIETPLGSLVKERSGWRGALMHQGTPIDLRLPAAAVVPLEASITLATQSIERLDQLIDRARADRRQHLGAIAIGEGKIAHRVNP